MKSDGSIIIDTKIVEDGMEKGFDILKDEMASVGITAKKVGDQIEMSFSNMDVSKQIANAANQIRDLETQLSAVTADLADAMAADDDKKAERLGDRQVQIYERLQRAREKLLWEVSAAADKQAAAEERASQKAAQAAEREAKTRTRAMEKELKKSTKGIRHFNSRLREIALGALVFNVISAGLRKVTDYFGKALKANDEFSTALKRLNGSLKVAAQPILEAITPALITMINWLNKAVQAVGRLFASLSGKSYKQMQQNAEALEKEANAIEGTGAAAKKAQRYLAGFDEINQAVKDTAAGASDMDSSIFEEVEMDDKISTFLDELIFRFKDIFFEWDNLTGEQIVQKLLTGLAAVAGGIIGFTLGGFKGALLGMVIAAGLSVVLNTLIFDGDGRLSGAEITASLLTVLGGVAGGLIGFYLGGPGGAAIGASIGLGLSFAVVGLKFDSIKNAFDKVSNWVSNASQKMANAVSKAASFMGKAYDHEFGMIGVIYDALVEKVNLGSMLMGESTQTYYVDPATKSLMDMFHWIGDSVRKNKDHIISNWELTARGTESGYIIPTRQDFAALGQWIMEKMSGASQRIVDNWNQAARTTETGYIIPTRQDFAQLAQEIASLMGGAKEKIMEKWQSLAGWFKEKVTEPIKNFFKSLGESIENIFEGALDKVEKAIDNLGKKLKKTKTDSESSSGSSGGWFSSASVSSVSYPTMDIPQLARGAVIPPNNKFLAVLGDQTSGTNIEAPLATIQEAVALVMEDIMQSNMAGHEATIAVLQQILEAVLGIELDGETITRAVNTYNKKMAIVKGV